MQIMKNGRSLPPPPSHLRIGEANARISRSNIVGTIVGVCVVCVGRSLSYDDILRLLRRERRVLRFELVCVRVAFWREWRRERRAGGGESCERLVYVRGGGGSRRSVYARLLVVMEAVASVIFVAAAERILKSAGCDAYRWRRQTYNAVALAEIFV